MALPSAQKVNVELHTSLLTVSNEINRASWKQVYSACLGRVVASQACYGRTVYGGKKVTPSFFDGKVFFDDKNYPAQIIGIVERDKNLWIWGYEKPINAPDACYQLAQEVRSIGTNWDLPPLKNGKQELGKGFPAEHLAIAAVGVTKNFYCYCKIEEKEYDLYVAFSKLPTTVFASINADTFFRLSARCLPMFNVEHRTFVESLLMWNGIPYEWKLKKLMAHFNEDVELSFEEEEGRVQIFAMKIL